MSDQPNADAPDSHNSESTCRLRNIPPEDQLPPALPCWKICVLWVNRVFMYSAVCFFGYICLQLLRAATEIPDCRCWTYIALSVFLVGLVIERWLLHEHLVHKTRIEDQSEIKAMIQEARNIQPRLHIQNKNSPQEGRPKDFDKRKKQVEAELQRLRKLGPGRMDRISDSPTRPTID